MLNQMLIIVSTALLSSLFTLGMAYLLFEHRLRRRLEEKLEQARQQLGELIRDRVRQGVLDAIASLPTSEVVQSAPRKVAETAADLVKSSFTSLLGEPRKGD